MHLHLYESPKLTQEVKSALGLGPCFGNYTALNAYTGTVNILNAIGNCTVSLVSGTLPGGYNLTVDNDASQVILTWPAYSTVGGTAIAIPNATFESGNTGWVLGSGFSIVGSDPYCPAGTTCMHWDGAGTAYFESVLKAAVTPGQSVTASCAVAQGASAHNNAKGAVRLNWYTAAGIFISASEGNYVADSSPSVQTSTVTATAPATATQVSVGGVGYRRRENLVLRLDSFAWSLTYPVGPTLGTNTHGIVTLTFLVTDSAGRTVQKTCSLSDVAPKLLSGFSRWFGSLDALTADVDQAIYNAAEFNNGTPASATSVTGRFMSAPASATVYAVQQFFEYVGTNYQLLTVTGAAPPANSSVCFSPDEQWIFIMSTASTLYAYQYNGTGFTYRGVSAPMPNTGRAIACSSDFRIAVSKDGSARVQVYQFNTTTYAFTLLGESTATVTAGQYDRMLAWSPNGRYIAGSNALADTNVYDSNAYPMSAANLAQTSTNGIFFDATGGFVYTASANVIRACVFAGTTLTSSATVALTSITGTASINQARTHIAAIISASIELRIFSVSGATITDLGNIDTAGTNPIGAVMFTNLT